MPGFPCKEASADTTISGADVPKPTITIPISRGGNLKYLATEAEPSINRSALQTSSTSPLISAASSVYICTPGHKAGYTILYAYAYAHALRGRLREC